MPDRLCRPSHVSARCRPRGSGRQTVVSLFSRHSATINRVAPWPYLCPSFSVVLRISGVVQTPYRPPGLDRYRLAPMSQRTLLYNLSLRKDYLPVETKTLPGTPGLPRKPVAKTSRGFFPWFVLSSVVCVCVCVVHSVECLGRVVRACIVLPSNERSARTRT